MSMVSAFMSQHSLLYVNKFLARHLGIKNTIMLTNLLDVWAKSTDEVNNAMLISNDEIENLTCIPKSLHNKIILTLHEMELISNYDKDRRGIKGYWLEVHEDEIEKFMKDPDAFKARYSDNTMVQFI